MKGTTQRALREIATLAESAVKIMGSKTQTDEVRRLQIANDNLKKEVELLKRELENVKGMLANPNRISESVNPKSKWKLRPETELSDQRAIVPSSTGNKIKKKKNRKTWVISDEDSDAEEASSLERRKLQVAAETPAVSRGIEEKSMDPGSSSNVTCANPMSKDGFLGTKEDKLLNILLDKVGVMVAARLEAIEDRLLPEKSWRPPRGSDTVLAGGKEDSRLLRPEISTTRPPPHPRQPP